MLGMSMNLPPLGKDIVPEKGVHIINKIDRGDTLRVRQFNHIRALQHPERDGQRALFLEMHSLAPVIGHLSPLSGPTAGGTKVHVWGTNFAGGDIYKCRFGTKGIVSAEYNNATGTISCVAPAFMDVASKNFDVPFTVVIFTTHRHSRRPTHVATHSRHFTYYSPEQQRPLLLQDPVPGAGPASGGTVVTVTGRELSLNRLLAYNCRFGSTVVPATFKHAQATLDLFAGETVSCTSPPHPLMQAGWVKFELVIGEASAHPATHTPVPRHDGAEHRFFYYGVETDAISIAPWSGPFFGVETMLRISMNASNMAHYKSSTSASATAPASTARTTPLQCRFGGQVVTPAIYDFHFKQLKCVVPKESLMPFAPFQRTDQRDGGSGNNLVNGGGMVTGQVTAGDVGEFANPMMTFVQTAERGAAVGPHPELPRTTPPPPPTHRAGHPSKCDPLVNDCRSNLEHMLSEAVRSAETDMRPIENAQVAVKKKVLPLSDPTCRADASILLSDLASRLRTRGVPNHARRDAVTDGISPSGDCDAVMSTAEQEINAALLSLDRLCDDGRDMGLNVGSCGQVMYAGKKTLLLCQATRRLRDAACHHWPSVGCYSSTKLSQLSRYVCKTTSALDSTCGHQCPKEETVEHGCPQNLRVSIVNADRGRILFDEDQASSGFLTVEWGLRNRMLDKHTWSKVGVSYTLCVWRRKSERTSTDASTATNHAGGGDDDDNGAPELIGKRPLSAAMVEETSIGGGMTHRAKFALPSIKIPGHDSVFVRIERSLADDPRKPGARRCQWSRRLPKDVCATAKYLQPKIPEKLDAVLVSMELAPRLSHLWHRESQRPSDNAPPNASSAYQWATGIRWRGQYSYARYRNKTFDTICVYAFAEVLGQPKVATPTLVDGFFVRDFTEGLMPLTCC